MKKIVTKTSSYKIKVEIYFAELIMACLVLSGCQVAPKKTKEQKNKISVEQMQVLQVPDDNGEFSILGSLQKKKAEKVFARYIEGLRWKSYWNGGKLIEQSYPVGEKIQIVYFLTVYNQIIKTGFCAPSLSVCATDGVGTRDGMITESESPSLLTPLQSIKAFSLTNFGEVGQTPIKPTVFEIEVTETVLPELELPTAIRKRIIPKEFWDEVASFKSTSRKWKQPTGCFCTEIFSFYDDDTRVRYVLRNCSKKCKKDFSGESVHLLERFMNGWMGRIGGYTDNPKDIELMKPRILKAEMFRLKTP